MRKLVLFLFCDYPKKNKSKKHAQQISMFITWLVSRAQLKDVLGVFLNWLSLLRL